MPDQREYLTKPQSFRDVSRGSPVPHSLKGEALVKARLTADTWRLEIVAEGAAKLEKPLTIENGAAIDMPALLALGKKKAVRFLKAMQCTNIDFPLGQGLWEGVPLREVLKLAGKHDNVRRVFWWGFHNDDEKQMFRSSLGLNQVLDTAPGELPPFVAYRLNGQAIPLVRGGPVRMVVPWAHGFKSIKWLQKIVLTDDYKTNDTYAERNNDPDSYLKTAAYLDKIGAETFAAGKSVTILGTAMVGLPGLERVEYWLRPDAGTHGKIADDDPAWASAKWLPVEIEPPPDNWGGGLPDDVRPNDIWGFDPATGKPREWLLRYSVVQWSVTLKGLKPGAYELRVRTVDKNGFAQPEPRRYPKSGHNGIQTKQIVVME
jgi:DMSO/TMAO reductase YedYZ molybdopterin-dependent catalytic subunit